MTDRRRNILKTLLLCLSQFQWLVGMIVGLAGLYLWVMFRRSSLFFSSSSYMLPVYFTLATGALLLFTGFLGSWVFTRDSTCLQGLFVYLLVMVFCLGSTASALVVHQSINLDTEVHPLSGVFQNYTGSSQDPNSRAVDILQESMECCGVQNYTDWLDTSWFIHSGGYALPLSCCNTTFTNCTGTVFLPDQFYQTACHQKIRTVFRFILLDIIVVMFASVFLEQVILLVITTQLMREPQDQHYQSLRD
uniref:Tetraspanin n=1 Tax=Neogobius melanostomus TaxID=47308 RepID=A0A8C6V1I4_9GOBI